MKKLFTKHTDKELKEKFLQIKSFAELADILEVKTGHLYYWLNIQQDKDRYLKFKILKKNGNTRIIYAPKRSFKILQKKLNYILSLFYNEKKPVQGFVKSKNIITNANIHLNKKLILNIDLEDFFLTINKGRVFGIFRNKPFNFSILISKLLVKMCCVLNITPQGAPTSPIISNFVCRSLDNDLTHLAKVFHCTYSRYADDITFSTNQKQFPLEIAEIIYNEDTKEIEHKPGKALYSCVLKHGFHINKQKTRIQNKHNRQSVTGITVNTKLNLSRKYIKTVKSMLYNWEINKKKYVSTFTKEEILEKALIYHLSKNPTKRYFYKSNKKNNFKNILRGKINFIKNVRGENDFIYAKLMNKFNQLDDNNTKHIPENYQEVIKENLWIIESDSEQGSAFLLKGIGFITCYHCVFDNNDVLMENLKIFQNPTKEYEIEILKYNKHIDIAILKIKDSDIDVKKEGFSIGDCSKLTFGSKLILAGYPERGCEFEPDIREMKVTRTKAISAVEHICVDTPIITGHSGGPIFDEENKVVGIATRGSRYKDSDKTTNNAFIKIDTINKI